MSKSLHIGQAAHAGLQAAQLAKRNFSGPRAILEGPQGFFPVTASDGSPAEITFDPNGDWRIFDVSFKPWASSRHTHAAIDTALKIKAQIKPGQEILMVEVRVAQDAARLCDRVQPKNESEAKFSLQHAVASALLRGKPTLEEFMPPFSNARVTALWPKISVVADEALTKAYPKQWGAQISVGMSDGSVLAESVSDAWGDPAWPLSTAEVELKAFQLMGKVGVDKEQIDSIFAAVRLLPEVRSLGEFSKRLQQANAG